MSLKPSPRKRLLIIRIATTYVVTLLRTTELWSQMILHYHLTAVKITARKHSPRTL